jgi:integrase
MLYGNTLLGNFHGLQRGAVTPSDTPPRGWTGAYLPVFDGRKQRVRELWHRRGQLVARLTTETPDGARKLVWHVLEGAATVAQARAAMTDLTQKRREGDLIAHSPADGIPWTRVVNRQWDLVPREHFGLLLRCACSPRFFQGRSAQEGESGAPLKNAAQFADYLRFLLHTGAPEKEALAVCWRDVDFERKQLTIASELDLAGRVGRWTDWTLIRAVPGELDLETRREDRRTGKEAARKGPGTNCGDTRGAHQGKAMAR